MDENRKINKINNNSTHPINTNNGDVTPLPIKSNTITNTKPVPTNVDVNVRKKHKRKNKQEHHTQADVDCNECIENIGHPYYPKPPLEKRFKLKLPLQKIFNAVLFKMVNPTNLPCSFNLFDGFSITPVPNTPNGYVPILNPLGSPIMNFPPSAGTTYPSFECAVVNQPFPPSGALNNATVYVSSTDRIYVVDDRFLNIINPNTNTVVNTISLTSISLGGGQAVYNPINNRVYITQNPLLPIGNSLDIIDCATETYVGSFGSTSGNNIRSIAFNPTNNTMYLGMGSDGNIEVLDCATNTGGVYITLAGDVRGIVIWVDGLNTFSFAVNSLSTSFSLINAATNTLISNYIAPSTASLWGSAICYNDTKNSIYYVNSAGTDIVEFTLSSFTYSNAVACSNTSSLMCIDIYNIIYFNDFYNGNNIIIINCATNTIANTVPVTLTVVSLIEYGSFAYDSFNNSVWVTRNNNGSMIQDNVSKLCGTQGMCYIVGSQDYNEFIQDLRNNPICVRQIQFFTQSVAQTTVPLEIQTKDANGNLCINPRLPNITISTDQFQPNISTLDFECKDMILDCLTTINQYTIAPNSEVTFIMYYKQISKVDILTSKETICGRLDKSTECSDGNSRTEEQVKFMSPRPHTRPNWIRPFSNSMIKDRNQLIDDCNTCFEELGRPIFNAVVNPIEINIPEEVFTLKFKLDSPDCNECFENIGHHVIKKLDKFYEKSVKEFDVIYHKVPLESFSNKCCLKDS